MLDFRKLFLALVVLMIASASAFAQSNTTCSIFSTPQNIRAEGVTELVGDIYITCTGGTPTAAGKLIPQATIQIFAQPYVEITSRLLGNAGFTEAVLFIDEPSSLEQQICGGPNAPVSDVNIPVCNQNTGTGIVGVSPYEPGFHRPNSWLGRRFVTSANGLSSNSLIWQGIQIDPPGTVGTRTIRIKNVRVNASLLGATIGSPANVSLQITITPGNSSAGGLAPPPLTAVVVNQQPSVATALVTHDFAYGTVSAAQCEAGTSYSAALTWAERVPSAWKQRSQALDNSTTAPATNDAMIVFYDTETGFYKNTANGGLWPTSLPSSPWGSAKVSGSVSAGAIANPAILGLADHGTRFILKLSNIPTQISVGVGALSTPIMTGSSVTGKADVTSSDANGAGAFASPGTTSVSVSSGNAQVVWEVLVTDTASFETFSPSVTFSWSAGNLPPVGSSINGRGWYAPLSQTPYASNHTNPIPRFLDNSVQGSPILTINACRSNLLFPFISNKGGFDTGLAISNTSRDPFTAQAGAGNVDQISTWGNYANGTANVPASQQSGICTLYYYGQTGATNYYAPSPQPVTNVVLAGDHVVWSLSSGGGAPALVGFQGYLIARCDFQYAHGFAFISDVGAQKLAMGYLALIFEGQTELKNRAPDKHEAFDN